MIAGEAKDQEQLIFILQENHLHSIDTIVSFLVKMPPLIKSKNAVLLSIWKNSSVFCFILELNSYKVATL